MTGKVIPIVTDLARNQWLDNYPAKFLACRQGHNFPKLIPGSRKFVRTWIERDEETQDRTIHQLCGSCGRERWRPIVRHGRGWILGGKSWKYKDPQGYAQPHGYGLTRADFADAYWDEIIGGYDESQEDIETALSESRAQNGR